LTRKDCPDDASKSLRDAFDNLSRVMYLLQTNTPYPNAGASRSRDTYRFLKKLFNARAQIIKFAERGQESPKKAKRPKRGRERPAPAARPGLVSMLRPAEEKRGVPTRVAPTAEQIAAQRDQEARDAAERQRHLENLREAEEADRKLRELGRAAMRGLRIDLSAKTDEDLSATDDGEPDSDEPAEATEAPTLVPRTPKPKTKQRQSAGKRDNNFLMERIAQRTARTQQKHRQ